MTQRSMSIRPTSIRPMADGDWPHVGRIYAAGIATGQATFETEVAAPEVLDGKWVADQRWIIEERGLVLGWAALTPVSARPCYRGVAESSIYIDPAAGGRGLGTRLLAHQVSAATEAGFWTLQTSIFPENLASLALHRRAGFRDVGRRERIAEHDGVWRDTLLLERRA